MKGHKWFAAIYDRMNRMDGTEKFLAEHRPHVAGEVQGRVLEVGAGTGANLSYFNRTAEVIASEPDPFMLERAKKRLRELGSTNIEPRAVPGREYPVRGRQLRSRCEFDGLLFGQRSQACVGRGEARPQTDGHVPFHRARQSAQASLGIYCRT